MSHSTELVEDEQFWAERARSLAVFASLGVCGPYRPVRRTQDGSAWTWLWTPDRRSLPMLDPLTRHPNLLLRFRQPDRFPRSSPDA